MSRKKIELNPAEKVSLAISAKTKILFKRKDIQGFIERKVTKFGNSAKIDFPRDYLGRKVYVVVCK